MTMCQYHPNEKHDEPNHGCFAVVGDLVEILNPMGQRCEIYGLVTDVETHEAIVTKRILTILGHGPVKDSFVRIVSRG